MQLRGYQAAVPDLVRGVFRHLPANRRRVLLVAPTGAGKTVTAAYLAQRKVSYGRRVLWVAHRTELVSQAAKSLVSLGLSVGVISASSDLPIDHEAPVQVASIQTLQARGYYPPADLIIFDEAHHAASDGGEDLLNNRYPNAQAIGLTATPQRGDGRSLGGDLFAELIVIATHSQLLEGGYIVPCEVVRPNRPLRPNQIAQRPVDAYLEHARNRSALVFSPNIKEATKHTLEFNQAGITAIMVDGDTPKDRRREALAWYAEGFVPVIVNVGCLTEGTDLPITSAVLLARGCGTEGLYLQITGRGLRPLPGRKTDCILADLRGVSHVHGDPLEDRVYSLDGKGISRSTPNPYTACRVCGCPIDPGQPCPDCGIGPQEQRELQITGDRLVRFARMRKLPPDDRAQKLAKWIKDARNNGHKEGRAFFKYKGVFGDFPPKDVMAAAAQLMKETQQ